MLPTGHAAAGYLVGLGVIKFLFPETLPKDVNFYAFWGAFFGFAPDLDEFWYFFKNKTLLVSGKAIAEKSHRFYLGHAPLLWLIVGLLVIFFSSDVRWQLMGYLIWLCSFSHFLLDSIENGIMWLWPFKTQLYALTATGEKRVIEEKYFFKHSVKFLHLYSKRISFYFELLIILTALIVYFK